jgi:hypothetical protein
MKKSVKHFLSTFTILEYTVASCPKRMIFDGFRPGDMILSFIMTMELSSLLKTAAPIEGVCLSKSLTVLKSSYAPIMAGVLEKGNVLSPIANFLMKMKSLLLL